MDRISPRKNRMQGHLPLTSVIKSRNFLRESLEVASVRGLPPTAPSSFQSMVTPTLVSQLRQLEARNANEELYTDIPQIDFSDVTLHGILGHGRFSTVYQVQLPLATETDRPSSAAADSSSSQQVSGGHYALKCIQPDRIKLYAQSKERASMTTTTALATAVEEMYREAILLARCHHRNIISLRGVAMEGLVGSIENTSGEQPGSYREQFGYFIALDLISETLAQRISEWRQHQQPGPLARISRQLTRTLSKGGGSRNSLVDKFPSSTVHSTPGSDFDNRGDLAERIDIATAIASAMAYLHREHRCVILDLCPESIGFDARTGEVKLFDLGLARIREQAFLHFQMDQSDPRYMAPEIMICQSSGFPGDIYSFGVLFWELLTLERPYEAFFVTSPSSSSSRKEVFEQSKFTQKVILNKQWRPSCTSIADPEARRLIQECWCSEPEARPNAQQVLWRLEQTIRPPTRRGSFSVRRASHQSQSSLSRGSTESSSHGRRGSFMRGLVGSFRKSATAESGPSGHSSDGVISDMISAAAVVAADPWSYLEEDWEPPSFQPPHYMLDQMNQDLSLDEPRLNPTESKAYETRTMPPGSPQGDGPPPQPSRPVVMKRGHSRRSLLGASYSPDDDNVDARAGIVTRHTTAAVDDRDPPQRTLDSY